MHAFLARLAALAVAGLAGAVAAVAETPVPGFAAEAVYLDGAPPLVRVLVRHRSARDRVDAVELRAPEGGNVFAHRLESETVTERRRGPGPGPSIGFGIGGGYGVGGGAVVGSGFGFGVPLGGTVETVEREFRSEAEIAIPDSADYRINWSFYTVRITLVRDDGRANVAVIGAPRP